MNRIVRTSSPETHSIDLAFAEKSNPVVIGVRLVGHVDYRSPYIQAALIGVLSYDDETHRTVADVVEV